jgi:hypothetical protein
MDALFFIHREGGPQATAALMRARDLTLDWIAQTPEGPIDARNPQWAPKPTADRAPYMAYLARQAACEGLLSSGQAETLLDSLRYHATLLVGHHPLTTKGLWADYGLALTGQYLMGILPEAPDWQALAISRFDEPLHARLEPREFLWLNNAANYQAMIAHLVHLFRTDVVPDDPELARVVTRMRDAMGWFVLPDRSITRFGAFHTMVPLQPWVAHSGTGHRGLHALRRSGYAFVRLRRSYLAANASHHFDSQQHADDLGFELFERGRRVIADTGHHDFDGSNWQAFAKSARAHSVLTVDGVDFSSTRAKYGSGIIATGRGSGWFAILGRNPRLRRQRVSHRRLFLYRPGRRLVLLDLVRARRRHTYRRHLQVAPGITTRRLGGDVRLRAPGLSALIRSSGRAKPEIAEGERRPLRGWLFPDTDRERPRPTVTYRDRGRSTDFVTALSFGNRVGPLPRVVRAGSRRIVVAVSAHRELAISRAGKRLRISR